tara:strand:- start:346 stop:525 length:180 start_codon:yes stop_codon:yes gene_type:complete
MSTSKKNLNHKKEPSEDILKYLDELTDILSGAFTIGKDKDVYQIKRRKSGKRNRDSKKS